MIDACYDYLYLLGIVILVFSCMSVPVGAKININQVPSVCSWPIKPILIQSSNLIEVRLATLMFGDIPEMSIFFLMSSADNL